MNMETGKQVWTAPKLEQIEMVDTANKGDDLNESEGDGQFRTFQGKS